MGSTLREALESAVSSQEAKESEIVAAPETPAAEPVEAVEAVQPAATEVPIGESAEQRAERLRDEKGRFVEGKTEAKSPKVQPVAAPEAVAVPAIPRPPKPDSWKKDYAQDWDKLDPRVAAYIKEREDQYFKGVSTYKQEWEGAKPLLDAVAPFMPDLQRFGVQPAQWISNLGAAHRALATGSPQEKLATVQSILRNNGIQAQLAVQDAQGQWSLLAPQAQPQPQQQQQQPQQPQNIEAIVEQTINKRNAQQKFAEFSQDIPTKYQHYETVKADMALLLEAGKAKDYPSAYEMSLRLHDDLFAATQAAKQKADEVARLEAQRKAVAAARGSVTSTKSATPASSGAATPKGRREALEEAYDQHASGRV